jgi:uncharacterized membrane protein YfcA
VLFVPALVAIGLTQVHAEATSLLAIVPTALLGAWRQTGYGNVRWRPALMIGIASAAATVGGAAVAVSVPGSLLARLFAVLLLFTAAQIARQALRTGGGA